LREITSFKEALQYMHMGRCAEPVDEAIPESYRILRRLAVPVLASNVRLDKFPGAD
jgi:hypothetical protein